MKTSDFDYHLPEELIAQFPEKERDQSRLLILDRTSGRVEHKRFFQIADYLEPGDALIINDTKVFPARLFGRKETGGKAQVLLLERVADHGLKRGQFYEEWDCLINAAKPCKPRSKLFFHGGLQAEVLLRNEEIYRAVFHAEEHIVDLVERIGFMPLPPYIRRDESGKFEGDDRRRYQSVYARERGAVAAPTAGLHFTEMLLKKMIESGIEIIPLTLHIGFATFSPVRVDYIEKHEMHSEYCRLTAESAKRINLAKANRRKVCAVGTTVVRTIEYFSEDGTVRAGEGMNDLFIYPGYTFKVVDRLITNFHLPKSTLLMLVCAFAGREKVFAAYQEAIEKKYRFYSYGDAMLIL
ncbi:MAG: tRNA preQ1(34) S-adenosylmethionine ribosyltransferase-isomerase QueA [Acidobacteriota bacterium]